MAISPLVLAQENSLRDLIEAVAILACMDTQDMMNDMLAEKNFIKQNGLPDKNDFKQHARGFLVDIYPEQLLEAFGDNPNSEDSWTRTWDCAVDSVIRRWPEYTKLTVDLSK